MYYKRGPFGLVIISILILGSFLALADNIEMNPKFFLLFAVFGCPLLSKLIYGGIKYSNEQSKRKELEQLLLKKKG